MYSVHMVLIGMLWVYSIRFFAKEIITVFAGCSKLSYSNKKACNINVIINNNTNIYHKQ